MLENSHDTENQHAREWFVLHEDRYRGPYFFRQICQQLEQGTLSPATLAWREGMADWETLSEIPAFRDAATYGSTFGFSDGMPGAPQLEDETSSTAEAGGGAGARVTTWNAALDDDLWKQDPTTEIEAQKKAVAQTAAQENSRKQEQKTGQNDDHSRSGSTTRASAQSASRSSRSPRAQTESAASLSAPGLSTDAELQAVENAALLGATREWNEQSWAELGRHNAEYDASPAALPRTVYVDPAALGLTTRPRLLNTKRVVVGGIIAILVASLVTVVTRHSRRDNFDRLVDVSREENREMLATMSESVAKHGPSASVAMSQSDPTAPFFYAATNLADGARFEVHIDGVQDTLLDKLVVSVRAQVTAKDGLARTPQFRQENGKPFPRGEYKISAICASCAGVAPGAMLAQKTYFLGGLRDRDYDQRLKAFHEQLRQSAQTELTEIRQLSDTLDGQLNDTIAQFQRVIAVLHRNKAVALAGTYVAGVPSEVAATARADRDARATMDAGRDSEKFLLR